MRGRVRVSELAQPGRPRATLTVRVRVRVRGRVRVSELAQPSRHRATLTVRVRLG